MRKDNNLTIVSSSTVSVPPTLSIQSVYTCLYLLKDAFINARWVNIYQHLTLLSTCFVQMNNFSINEVLTTMFHHMISFYQYIILEAWVLESESCHKINFAVNLNAIVFHTHYNDVIMGAMASQITCLTIVYSTFYPGADQRKHQSSAPLAFVWGIHRSPVHSPHKGPVMRKMFPFDDVIISFETVAMLKCGQKC